MPLRSGRTGRSTYDRYLSIVSASSVSAERADGMVASFTLTGAIWTPDTDVDLKLTNAGATWTLTDHDDTAETYTASGAVAILNSITLRNGYTQTLHYTGGALTSVSDSYGRSLSFTYTGGLLITVTVPDSLVVTYGYVPAASRPASTTAWLRCPIPPCRLTSQTYHYAQPGLPFALTGVTDEDGNGYQSWTYDATGRGTSSQRGTGPTADITQVAYDDMTGFRTITDVLGAQETYKFIDNPGGVPIVMEIDRAAFGSSPAATRTFGYDANGYLASQTDWNGNLTTYVNDVHGDPTTINEAVGSPVAAHDDDHLRSDVCASAEPDHQRRADHNVRVRRQRKPPYPHRSGHHHPDGPVPDGRTDADLDLHVAELPAGVGQDAEGQPHDEYGYDGSGALTSTTNALQQTTQITQHTGGGYPQIIVDPNNVTTTLDYDARLRLTSQHGKDREGCAADATTITMRRGT